MLKKSLIFGSVALLLAALITLTGCPTSVDDGSSGTVYAHRIYGTNVDPYIAQEAIDRAVAAGEPIFLERNLTISPAGHLNFKNARVTIDGDVTFANGVVNVVDAVVDWAPGAVFDLGHYIHRKGMSAAGHVDPANLVEYADSLDTIMATATAAAVRRFTLGPKADHDYSTDSAGISARIVAESLGTLYILDTLTLPIDGTAPSAVDITALGTLDVTGTRPGVSLNASGSDLILGTCSTLTSSQGGVIVYTPGAATIPSVEVQEGKPFTVQQAAAGLAGLNIPGKLKGRGTLEVSTATTAITIKGGEGNIRFTGNAAPTKIESDSTGTLTFDYGFTSLNTASAIAGDVEFKGNVETTEALKLLGNVTLVNGTGITLTTTEPLTLGAGKTVSVKITPTAAGSGTTLAPVLTAGSTDVILTPVSGVTLTAAPAPGKNAEDAVNLAKKIILGGDDLTITIGTLQVAPGAIFEVNNETLITNIPAAAPFDRIGYLAVADTGTLSLTNAGASLVVLGDTEISATTASTLKAAGGTVILGNNKIYGDAPGATLTAATGGTGLAITLDDGLAGGTVLILQQVNLNLALHGSLVITGHAVNTQVTLADLAKITLNNGEGGKVTDRNKIGAAGNFATLNGDFEALTAGTATTSQAAWSVAHKGGSYVRIASPAAGTVSLAKSGTSFVL
jgi:hypothetical protein